jgi:hypothetical protein
MARSVLVSVVYFKLTKEKIVELTYFGEGLMGGCDGMLSDGRAIVFYTTGWF